ncbi:hypothetical protein [Streptomyces coeruleofuscus]|uniref:Uncharacterized protein n=1 Tax=Streptomyces coeruleofuscus TaxID=66879 RepID=A0ABN3JC41_9ACTN
MDSTVVAALIAAPTAIIAATAAYAAGRAQARGAHQGPVDAVRREHQRDAYAAFAKAARAFQASTHPQDGVVIRAAGQDPSQLIGRAGARAAELRSKADNRPLKDAYIVVELEGPKHVAELAESVVSHAASVLNIVCHPLLPLARMLSLSGHGAPHHLRLPPLSEIVPRHVALTNVVEAFVVGARDHLNGRSR